MAATKSNVFIKFRRTGKNVEKNTLLYMFATEQDLLTMVNLYLYNESKRLRLDNKNVVFILLQLLFLPQNMYSDLFIICIGAIKKRL